MTYNLDIEAIVKNAKKKGYFDPNDLKDVSLNMDQFRELHSLLQKKKIPLLESKTNNKSKIPLNTGEALGIIKKLRLGIPAANKVSAYSVGQELLLSDFKSDLKFVRDNKSRVRFLNGNYGRGKTHALHLLREIAFQSDFVVSEVTLSPDDCPLHEFMSVYRQIIRGIRTKENLNSTALENILERWLNNMRNRPPEEVRRIVYTQLPTAIKDVLGAYYEAQNFLRNSAKKKQMVLKYLYGNRLYVKERKSLGIETEINETNSLMMLAQIANLVRYIGYRGICILFDEAESTHSFAYYVHRDKAFQNLRKITQESKLYPNCYFLYATTPSFFDSYYDYSDVVELEVMELEELDKSQRLDLCNRIGEIYCTAFNWKAPSNVTNILKHTEDSIRQQGIEIGDLVRAVVSALDESRRKQS